MIAIRKLIRINQTLFENLSADFECQISIAITIAIKNRSRPINVEEKKMTLPEKLLAESGLILPRIPSPPPAAHPAECRS